MTNHLWDVSGWQMIFQMQSIDTLCAHCQISGTEIQSEKTRINSNSNLSYTDSGGKASMSDPCHSHRDHDRGEARSKAACSRLHLLTWKYSQPRTMGKESLVKWFKLISVI